MKWAVLLALVGAVAAVPRSVRKARFAALPADVKDDNYDLKFASAMWRHGDRAPEHAVPGEGTDQFTEDDFKFGGGGYGELSPLGMQMHFNLGRKLRDRYIDTTFKDFLHKAYNAKEIYIRSTDYNRTLVSAYSNVAGMYSGNGVDGQNAPTAAQCPDWPVGYIPIPVHTVDYGTDYVGHPDAACPRQDELYALVQNSIEYQNYINDPQISQILEYLSNSTNSSVTIDNMYDLADPLFCEKQHICELKPKENCVADTQISELYPWYYTGDIPEWADWITDKDEDFTNGLGNPGGVNGVDVSVEIPKIRAGDTLKLVVSQIHGVIACADTPNDAACRNFYKQLKYTALSAHDTTLAAFLTILGVKKYIIPVGYPNYSAAILIEIYEKKNADAKAPKERFFKVLYHADQNDDFKAITSFVRGCDPRNNYCAISVLDDLVAKYAPDVDMATLCNTPVDQTTTTPAPNADTTTNIATKSTTSTTETPTTSSVSALSIFSPLAVMLAYAM